MMEGAAARQAAAENAFTDVREKRSVHLSIDVGEKARSRLARAQKKERGSAERRSCFFAVGEESLGRGLMD